jgi:hypothetical protein
MSLLLNVMQVSVVDSFIMGDLKHWLKFNIIREVVCSMEVEWMVFGVLLFLDWRNKEIHENNLHRPIYPSNDVLKRI